MKTVHVRGSAQEFVKANNMKISSKILGVYVSVDQTAYIFLDEISNEARMHWLFSRALGHTFNGQKGLQRFYIRLRKLVEYHEYSHHLQHRHGKLTSVLSERIHNEHVADRYAQMRYRKEYGRAAGINTNRKHLSPKEVLG